MQARILKLSELDLQDRLTAEHYISDDLELMDKISQGKYRLIALGKLASVRGGKRLPAKAQYSATGIPYVRVVDIGSYKVELDNVVYISSELHKIIKRYQLEYNDIAIVIVGATIGKVAIFKSSVRPCNFNENMARITVRDGKLNPDYLLTYLQSHYGQAYISWLTGGAAQAKLSLERIRRVEIPLPPRPIQDRIAAVMQDAYAQRREKLTAAEGLLGGIEAYVFDRLDINPASMKEKNRFLKPISKVKAERSRFDVAFNMGFHKFDLYADGIKLVEELATFPKKTRNPGTYPDKHFKYIDISSIDITTGEISEPQTILGIDAPSRARQVVHTNDIIVSTVRPTRGAIALIPEDMDNYICSTGFTIVRPKENVIAEYLHIVLRLSTTLEQFGRRSAGTSYPAILENDIRATLIPVPDKQTQIQMVTEVTRRRTQAAQLRQEAETVVTEAKAQVERMILGEETA